MKKLREEFGRMKGMRFGEAVDHLWTYYRFHLLVLALCAGFAVFLLHAAFGPRVEPLFSALLVDAGAEAGAAERLEAELTALFEPEEKTQTVTVDAMSVTGDNAAAGLQRMVVRVIAGELDVILCTDEIVNYLLKSGALSDLSEILPKEALERWEGRTRYADTEAIAAWTEASNAGDILDTPLVFDSAEGMAVPVSVALDVTEPCRRLLGRPEGAERLYCVAVVTTTHPESVARFLDYLEAAPALR